MTTFRRICIKDYKDDNLNLVRGQEYLTSREKNKKVVVFTSNWAEAPSSIFAGEIKFTAEIANKLAYKWPYKLIAVASIQGEKVNISFRGNRARLYVEKALEKAGIVPGGRVAIGNYEFTYHPEPSPRR